MRSPAPQRSQMEKRDATWHLATLTVAVGLQFARRFNGRQIIRCRFGHRQLIRRRFDRQLVRGWLERRQFIVDEDIGVASVSAAFPQGTTMGDIVLDATETDAPNNPNEPGPNCTSTHVQMSTPTEGQMPSDTPNFMAPIVNGEIKGTFMFTVDSTPPHNYSVTYDFSDR